MNALREQLAQVRQKPPTQGAALEALAASSKTNELEKLARRALAVGNSLNKSHGVYKRDMPPWAGRITSSTSQSTCVLGHSWTRFCSY